MNTNFNFNYESPDAMQKRMALANALQQQTILPDEQVKMPQSQQYMSPMQMMKMTKKSPNPQLVGDFYPPTSTMG